MKTIIKILCGLLILGAFTTVIAFYIAIGVFVVSGSFSSFTNVVLVGLIPATVFLIMVIIPDRYYEDLV